MSDSQTQPEAFGTDTLDTATRLLKAMANHNRLRILDLLSNDELSVTQLNQRVAISQSALSQHLAILRRDNLVHTRRESQTIYYSLKGNLARTIIDTLASLDLANTSPDPHISTEEDDQESQG